MTPTGVLGQAAIGDDPPWCAILPAHVDPRRQPVTAFVAGTERTLTLDGPFYFPGGFTLSDGRRYEEPRIRHAALHFEGAEVARCVAGGRLESGLRALEDSLVTLGALDAIHERAAPVMLAR